MLRRDVILVGAGGYGKAYVEGLLNEQVSFACTLKAVIDPYAEQASSYQLLKDAKIPIFESLDTFFAQHTTDLTIVCTPIHLHFAHCLTAIKNGSHVLCEKPLVPLLSQVAEITDAAKKHQKLVGIGFQWSFYELMLTVKKAILAGTYGKPIRFKTYISWPRPHKYYQRGWAGKTIDDNGNYILDSIANNATAHYIHNMLFMLGDAMDTSAEVDSIQVATYKANNITSYDTIAFKGKTVGGCELLYLASHATNLKVDPIIIYEFEHATFTINLFNQQRQCVVHHKNGQVEEMGILPEIGIDEKILGIVGAINGTNQLYCTPQTVTPHIRLVNAIYAQTTVNKFPEEFVKNDQQASRTYVKNLHMDFYQCFEQGKLPSELDFAWCKKETIVQVHGFEGIRM